MSNTLQEFTKEHNLAIESVNVPNNTNMNADPEWNKSAYHYVCTIKYGKGSGRNKSFTTSYSVGSEIIENWVVNSKNSKTEQIFHGGIGVSEFEVMKTYKSQSTDYKKVMLKYAKMYKPQLTDLLECLYFDCSLVLDYDFEEWADNAGYNVDSRKAERTYNTCKEQAKKLKAFLSNDLFNNFLALEIE